MSLGRDRVDSGHEEEAGRHELQGGFINNDKGFVPMIKAKNPMALL